MIIRNFALGQGRRALLGQFCQLGQLSQRGLSTDSTTTTTTSKTPDIPRDSTTGSTVSEAMAQLPGVARSRTVMWTRRKKNKGPDTTVADFAARRKLEPKTLRLGAVVERPYLPSSLITNPPAPKDVTLELLMASQTHMGHHTARWNPANSRYILGVRNGIHIISLEQTAAALRRAARVVEEVTARGGLLLFVGTRPGQMEIVVRAAELAGPGSCHFFSKWVPGTITNRDVLLSDAPMTLVDERDAPLADRLLDLTGHRLQYEPRPLKPDLVVVLNPMENRVLLHECGLSNVPTIGIIDTDADPARTTYAIPANDDSLRSVAVIAGVLGRAGGLGTRRRLRNAAQGVVEWQTSMDLERAWEEGRRMEAGSAAEVPKNKIKPWILAGGRIF